MEVYDVKGFTGVFAYFELRLAHYGTITCISVDEK